MILIRLAQREVYYCEGTLVLPNDGVEDKTSSDLGYSNASKFRNAKKYSAASNIKISKPFIVLDIETDGLDECKNSIIEIAAIKVCESENQEFSSLIKQDISLPKTISDLTGITDSLLHKEGRVQEDVLNDLLDFIKTYDLGYKIDLMLSL